MTIYIHAFAYFQFYIQYSIDSILSTMEKDYLQRNVLILQPKLLKPIRNLSNLILNKFSQISQDPASD